MSASSDTAYGDYLLCGWRVRSELPLPELLPWSGDAKAAVSVTVCSGELPDRLENAVNPANHLMTVGPDGDVLLHIPGLVKILAVGGHSLTVHILRPGDPGWRLYLLGAALAYLCHQRGLLPLHAATLVVGGKAIAIAGPSGYGKSTLALALSRRGHLLLSDDVTVLSPATEKGGKPLILPAYPRLKLWRDSIENFGEEPESFRRVREGLDKFDLCGLGDFDPTPRPLDGVMLLGKGEVAALTAVPKPLAMVQLFRQISRMKTAHCMGRRPQLFAEAGAIAGAVPVWQLTRSADFADLPALVALVEGLEAP